MELPEVLRKSSSFQTFSPVIPLLSIPLESLRPLQGRRKSLLTPSPEKKSVIIDDGDDVVDSVIPSLMSLTLSPPVIIPCLPSPPDVPCPPIARYDKTPLPPPSFHQRSVTIVEVERTNKTRREFVFVAREVTRENFEPPAGSRIIFAYYTYPSGKKELVGVASFQDSSPFSSKASEKEDRELYIYDFYNLIHYIFFLRDFRGFGFGRQMVQEIERRFYDFAGARDGAGAASLRPIRVQAGTRAVGFFESLGYRRVSIGKDSICCGTPIFRTLYNMTKNL